MTEPKTPLGTPAQGDEALDVTLRWLHETASRTELGSPPSGDPTPDALASRLKAADLPSWAEIIRATFENSAEPQDTDPRVRWLATRAAVELAASADHARQFELIENLQSLGEITDRMLADLLAARLSGETDDHALMMALEGRMRSLYGSPFYEHTRRYEEARPEQPFTTRDLWPGSGDLPMGDGWAHRTAAQLWPTRYLETLAGFPPPFQHAAIEALYRLDVDTIVDLISASPSLFSPDGTPAGPAMVFGLLDSLEPQLASKGVQDPEAARSTLHRVLDAVFARVDGHWTARAWLQHSIWRGRPRRAGRSEAEATARRGLTDELVREISLRAEPLGLERALAWTRNEEPLWQVNRVLAECSILNAHGDSTAAAGLLAEAVSEGLVSATGRSAGLVTSSLEAEIVGHALSGIKDPQGWFEDLWRRTYDIREHLSYESHRNLDNPAYPALAWGLQALNCGGTSTAAAAPLWRSLAARVFETQIIDPNAHLPDGPLQSICRATIKIGAHFLESGVLPSDDLASFLSDQLEPSAEHAFLWHVARSSASDAMMLQVGRGVDAPLLREALERGLQLDASKRWDAILDADAREDLKAFAARLETQTAF